MSFEGFQTSVQWALAVGGQDSFRRGTKKKFGCRGTSPEEKVIIRYFR